MQVKVVTVLAVVRDAQGKTTRGSKEEDWMLRVL